MSESESCITIRSTGVTSGNLLAIGPCELYGFPGRKWMWWVYIVPCFCFKFIYSLEEMKYTKLAKMNHIPDVTTDRQ